MDSDDLRFLGIAFAILGLCFGVALYCSDSIADAISRRSMQRWASEQGLTDGDLRHRAP